MRAKLRAVFVPPRRTRMSTATQTKPQSSTLSSRGMLIGGQWVESALGARITVENPAKRAPIAEVPRGTAADVERAVAAATRAYADWRKVVPRERGKALLKIADSIQARTEELARTIALETGNALRTQARGEAGITADIFRYFGGLASELKGETLPLGEHVLSYTRREPLGVVGAIIPWNAPVMLAALKIAPALCAGNTMVMKAAEDAPLGVLLMAEICQEFLPPGVLNVLTGYGEECGGPLANHAKIRKLSFTGSTEVGKIIMRAAAERIVPVSLELGGKSPSIVYPYVDEGLKRTDAKLVFGGLPPKSGPLSEGYFAIPTVFADRSNDWRLAREEIFGPVLVAIRWSDEAEAIRMANDSHYGLAAYVWTHDIGAGLRTAHAIESGWVQVNQG